MSDGRRIYSVSHLNKYVKSLLERDELLMDIWLRGEISNFKRHSSGHLYFTMKDSEGAVSAVMFASDARRLQFYPENGKMVKVRGSISLFEKTGAYQIYVRQMEQEGTGDLYLAFEQLKKKLEAQGLFDPAHRKKIPFFPSRVGIVTSPTGAAIRDIVMIAKRRFPGVSLVLYPALVQGRDAAPDIVRGLRTLDARADVDVIIVGRGGGSIEDLWAFNEEIVAGAIYACKTPVISAVGHETDQTIADFVSDMRASTPSAAAELAVPDVRELLGSLDHLGARMNGSARRNVHLYAGRLSLLKEKLERYSPQRKLADTVQTLDLLRDRMDRSMEKCFLDRKTSLYRMSDRLKLCSPLYPLEKGYALIMDDCGGVVTDSAKIHPGDELRIRMKDAALDTIVKTKTEVLSND
ncbi:MAG: exodeoxyribonuclease VII large subunit [Lachnospiraceae bacterium]|nr:exodeoxyribonuclease VII large subunit [Lachnospiraceae bacterium]